MNSKIQVFLLFLGITLFYSSCTKDILDQIPTTELGASQFWLTEADATTALAGAYSATRPLFDRDYYFDGHGEYVFVRGLSNNTNGGTYGPSGYGAGFDTYYRNLYGGIHRTNYVIENVKKMLPTASATSRQRLETVIGEARLLRGMIYFRLISMWGDVPYIGKIIYANSEVENIERLPINQVKDSILADFNYAFEKLPAKSLTSGRASKPAALAFRGKLQLFWACWNKFGWPELDTFKPSPADATIAYTAAAADFKSVIDNYGLKLFRNGDPGQWGTMGNADILPNYFYLFIPITGNPNTEGEMIMTFTHGGIGTDQGEELMRDVASRSHEGSQGWLYPFYELADRYQSTVTGDFAEKLIPTNPSTAGARTKLNSAVNPASYANRDYRMKASIMWDYEMSIGFTSLKSVGYVPFIYKTWNAPVTINGVNYISYNCEGAVYGYVFRKFLRNYESGLNRSEGDYSFPVMRLADVFLMYAEATNELKGPQADAVSLVNQIRRRGNLPALKPERTGSKEEFFKAIEQERIIELLAEGQRGFDLRRWRAIERVWNPPYGLGVWKLDSHGANRDRYYQNLSEIAYQQNYIFRIPPGERDRNPKLTQNKPWL